MTIYDELSFDLSQVLKICCNISSKEYEDVLKWVSLSYNLKLDDYYMLKDTSTQIKTLTLTFTSVIIVAK